MSQSDSPNAGDVPLDEPAAERDPTQPDDGGGGEMDLTRELEDARQRALRAQADLENFRKRILREQQQDRKYATIELLRDLLPVIDNLHRAIEAAEQSPDSTGLLEGVRLVSQQVDTVLSKHQCQTIPATGEAFDPNYHEAVSQLPSDDHPQGAVITVTQTGYQLHDRVVRPSQVVVSSGPPEQK